MNRRLMHRPMPFNLLISTPMQKLLHFSGLVVLLALASAPAQGQGSVAGPTPASPAPPGEAGEHVVREALPTNPAASITTERIAAAPTAEPANWLTYHGGYDAQRYSRLDQITTENAGQLEEVWRMYLPVPHAFEATPLVVDGTMYFTTGGHTAVYAVDAVTGEEKWHHTERIPDDVAACCDWVNRGVALGDGLVFFTTLDARLLALDAQTGETVWEQTLADYRDGYTATVAPLFVKGMVISGISGGEYGIRGFLDAFDARTGEKRWRFWTVPEPGEPGSETWEGDLPTWMTGGGATWVTGSYDPALDLLYWSIGNPGPDFNGEVRPGDNLYTNSVVALDPDDGALQWHFQFTPHDVWDYDGVNELVLADVTVEGRPVRALLHADKNGHYYVLDRTDGSFLLGKPFARVSWTTGLDPETGRPAINPPAKLTSAFEPVCPGPAGAKEWMHMAFSPETEMVYLPVIENCAVFRAGQAFYRAGLPFWGSAADVAAMGPDESHGFLRALDATTGETTWEIRTEHPVAAGALATAGGLVFWGEATGMLHATDAQTGEDVWTHEAPMGVHAAGPMTYAVDGKQYVAIPVGWGGWINGYAPGLADRPRGHLLVVYALP